MEMYVFDAIKEIENGGIGYDEIYSEMEEKDLIVDCEKCVKEIISSKMWFETEDDFSMDRMINCFNRISVPRRTKSLLRDIVKKGFDDTNNWAIKTGKGKLGHISYNNLDSMIKITVFLPHVAESIDFKFTIDKDNYISKIIIDNE